MRVIALAVALFLITVSASWGSGGGVSGSATLEQPASHVKTRWRPTVARLPADRAIFYETVEISSISCSSPGNCTAVGSYVSHGQHLDGLLLTETAGHWGRGVEAALPASAASDPQVGLTSVSCASAGNCTAGGSYEDSSGGIYSEGGELGLLLTERAGHWRRGVAYGKENAQINSVSCSSAGNCSAVGYDDQNFYGRDSGSFGDALLLTKEGGKWRRVELSWPAGGPGEGATLTAVSCASAGSCSAVGEYDIGIDQEAPRGVLLTETAGTWRRGVTAKPPKNAPDPGSSVDYVDLEGISCASAGNCGAMGTYDSSDGSEPLMLLTEEAGHWRRGVEALVPEDVPEPPFGAGISCASPGNCGAVAGFYNPNYNGRSGALLIEIAGRWEPGVKPPPDVPSAPRFDFFNAVSCASPGICSAVGGDPNRDHGVLLDGTVKPCVVPALDGLTLSGATRRLESHNCSVGKIKHAPSSTIEAGRVIAQRPQPGRRRPSWSKVNLRLSSGP